MPYKYLIRARIEGAAGSTAVDWSANAPKVLLLLFLPFILIYFHFMIMMMSVEYTVIILSYLLVFFFYNGLALELSSSAATELISVLWARFA